MARKTATATKPTPELTLVKEGEAAALPAVQQQGGAVATASADPIFAIIERLAKDPAFDVEKMERLIKMQQGAKADNARAEYDQAMSLAQAEMKMIRANKANSQTSSKYATQAALDRAIRPIYTKHGFALSTTTGDAPNPQDVRVLTTVSHRGGHREIYKLDVPADGKGAKGNDVMTRTHAVGAALTYGGRYLEKMIFNLAIAGDNDGNDAADPAERAKIWTDGAIQELNALEKDKVAFAKWTTANEKSANWLKKNAPEEFARYQIAYTNAAERAGIKNEEPKRGGGKKAKEPEAPAHDPKTGEIKEPETVGEVLDRKPPVTDVVDQNEAPLSFEAYKRIGDFFIFADDWLVKPERTEAELVAFGEFYADYMNERLDPTFKSKAVHEAMVDTKRLLTEALKKRQPG